MSNLPLKVKMLEHLKSLGILMSSGDMLRAFLYASPQCVIFNFSLTSIGTWYKIFLDGTLVAQTNFQITCKFATALLGVFEVADEELAKQGSSYRASYAKDAIRGNQLNYSCPPTF